MVVGLVLLVGTGVVAGVTEGVSWASARPARSIESAWLVACTAAGMASAIRMMTAM
jgi:hypothetical protein